MKLPAYLLLAAGLAATPALAQHQNHQMPGMTMPSDTTHRDTGKGHKMNGMAMPGDSSHAGHHMAGMEMSGMNMSHAYSRNLPMNRNGSGTAWQPDQTPMYMWMQHKGPWMLMYHGAAFGRYTSQNFNHRDARGHRNTVDGPNWFMTMAQREVGERGLLNFSLMMSLDPLTETRGGYPLLFQTGESYKGQPLIDKQHPHDLFSGLSVAYTYAFSKDIDLTAYLGYPGEPTIGPTAFMHRISAMPNPDAPLSHHWTDATHITYGVASLGLRYKQFKLEGSNFTGREPDQYRYDFDRPRADSWAARLNWNPTSELALQVSRAFIKSPEDLHPDENVRRTTASVLHSRTWGDHQFIASSLVWGMNEGHGAHPEHAVLAETNLTLGRPTFYGRYEFVQKDSEELSYYVPGPADAPLDMVFNIHTLTVGSSYRLTNLGGARGPELSVGGQLTGYVIPSTLQNNQNGRLTQQLGYGKLPLSASVYVRLTAPWMQMGRM
jgi:nitrous oxide reductase accessory protein NosL